MNVGSATDNISYAGETSLWIKVDAGGVKDSHIEVDVHMPRLVDALCKATEVDTINT